MFRSRLLILLLLTVLPFSSYLVAQESPPVPTLLIPTLVPPLTSAEPVDVLLSESALADIIATGVFRVGVLFNDPPYSELTLSGELRGFDVDLLRKIATTWGSEIEFVQVTRINAIDRLVSGAVHVVASALVHYRDLDTALEFSQTYLRGKQALMLSFESPYAVPADARDQTIGFVLGTRTEKALDIWSDRLGRALNLQSFLTLDRAAAALTRAEIAGLVAEEQALLRVTADSADLVRILDEPVVSESHAFAVRRQDAPMRQLLDRTIQFLASDGELDVLFREFFPDDTYDGDVVTHWSGIGDEVNPTQFSSGISYPSSYALPRVMSGGVLRVGGISDSAQASTAGRRRLAELNRSLAAEMARRWGVDLELVLSNPSDAVSLLNSGRVDLVVGVKPDWSQAETLDFSVPYLLHGDRLMVRANSGIQGFNNLRGRFVGILTGDATAGDRAEAWADSINASIRLIRTTERGAALTLLDNNNANAIYADSLSLLTHLEANPNSLRLTDRWYSRSFYTFALPYNDPDFRLLVNYTLQELIVDGALYRLTAPLILSDDLPAFDIIPGASQFAGINLSLASVDAGP